MANKYIRHIPLQDNDTVDVYDVLEAFNVTCPAIQHAVKKLLCAGSRGYKTKLEDIWEARSALKRAVQLQEHRLKTEIAKEIVSG